MENILYVRQSKIVKNIKYDCSGRAFVWYRCHGNVVKKFLDFHLLIQVFVSAKKPQLVLIPGLAPTDIRWIGHEILVKRSFIEDALDDVLQRWGYSVHERECMMNPDHEVSRCGRVVIRKFFEVIPSTVFNQWDSAVPNWMLSWNHWYLPRRDWRLYDQEFPTYYSYCHDLVEQQKI